eukprot:scaffold13887_cov120-Skeletonema_dohrnii-CCMP3373.AAC.2
MQRRIQRLGKDESLDGRKMEESTPSAFSNGGKCERSITPCTILPCVSLFLYSAVKLLCGESFSKLKEIRDACNGDLDDYCDIIFQGRNE